MPRFPAVLEAILETKNVSQSELARLCGLTPGTVGDYIDGTISMTRKSLAVILRGITEREDQVRLLLAYLDDQVPEELRDEIKIEPQGKFTVEEDAIGLPQDALADLNPKLRDKLALLVQRLRDEPDLRALLERTIDYISADEERVYRRANQRLGSEDPSAPVRKAVAAARRSSSSSRSKAS